MGNAPEFPLGLLVGVLSVLGTAALAGLVLLAAGADDWHTVVNLVFLAHVPLAALEGLILGCVVGFLARVKPELLGERAAEEAPHEEPARCAVTMPPAGLLLLAAGALLAAAAPARAHRLDAVPSVDKAKKRVRIRGFFETGAIPQKSNVQVFHADGSLLTEGVLDADGVFAFSYERAEPLRVVVSAPGGHRTSLRISAKDLGGPAAQPPAGTQPAAAESGDDRSRARDVLIGIGFLLALASFWLSLRNARALRKLTRTLSGADAISPRETPRPAPPPTGRFRR
jgi:hypothetical protein